MGSYELSKESFEEKQIKILKTKIESLKDELKLIESISDEMAKDLIEQSEFLDGGFESIDKYHNYKQSRNKQD